MPAIKRKKCRHCHLLFIPDPRNKDRQNYCRQPACRKASKADSQHRWHQKPENRDYFRDSEHVRRVQRWRAAHPDYWRRKPRKGCDALQDPLIAQPFEITVDRIDFAQRALQDLLTVQTSVIMCIIAQLTGCALQDDIVMAVRRVCNDLATISFIPLTEEVAMTVKSPICPERIRKVPGQFSWLDQRLISEHYIDRCTHGAAALYLFLVTVADARGLSYYADHTLCRRLAMDECDLVRYRQQLIDLGLIAYRRPLCQVLAIAADALRQNGPLQSLEQVFKRIGEGLK